MNINKKNTYLLIIIFLILIISLKSELINIIPNNNITKINTTIIDIDYVIKQNIYGEKIILDNIFDDNIDPKIFKKIVGKFIKFIVGLQVF
jgi:hypothetical protein